MSRAISTIRQIVKELESKLDCNCDLDGWEPERDTGHSWVCRIHKAARASVARQCSQLSPIQNRAVTEEKP